MARRLRAVTSDEKPEHSPPAKPLTITEAAKADDHLALLKAMRDRIAGAVQDPECPPRDLAALTRRLDDLSKQIRAFKVEAEEEARERSGPAEDAEWDASAI